MNDTRAAEIKITQTIPIADLLAILKDELASMISMLAKFEEEFGKRTFGNENSRMQSQMSIEMHKEYIEEYKMRLDKLEQNDNKGTRYYFAIGEGSTLRDGLERSFRSLYLD